MVDRIVREPVPADHAPGALPADSQAPQIAAAPSDASRTPSPRRVETSNEPSPAFPINERTTVRPEGLALPAATRPAPLSEDEIVAIVNNELREAWERHGLAPASAATDAEWARRTYLRLLGRIPSVDELQRFVDGKSPAKREELVQSLLYESQYADQYADYWSTYWSNVLIGRLGVVAIPVAFAISAGAETIALGIVLLAKLRGLIHASGPGHS